MMPQRRLFFALPAALVLAGCGFRLRGAPDLAFRTLYVNAAETSPIGNELKRNLASLGDLVLITDAALQPSAEAVLDILSETREKTVVGMNTAGQVREFQLRSRIRFQLRTPKGKELIAPTELLLKRDISFNESAVLAKEAEEGLMYRDMQSDIVQQLIRRLAAVKSL
jgi:LPS-assembly lipoprotein